MNKHTPGPWGIEHRHGEINVISCNERDSEEKDMGIVYVLARDVGGMIHGEKFDDRSEVEANARLIAAAPELLAALKLTSDCLAKCLTGGEVSAALAGRALTEASEAVTKATGV
ncbi:hypothetical protein [Pseudomonas pseudonitroreducens]|uniref:hypothetical protein n=1 Tax=Pseudomonas pseudonitroreducens TaxID=2892326 RepID=UPI001F1EE442|nr:hypothetical protein [Pseudomonas pseudonitroreducens]